MKGQPVYQGYKNYIVKAIMLCLMQSLLLAVENLDSFALPTVAGVAVAPVIPAVAGGAVTSVMRAIGAGSLAVLVSMLIYSRLDMSDKQAFGRSCLYRFEKTNSKTYEFDVSMKKDDDGLIHLPRFMARQRMTITNNTNEQLKIIFDL